jgi:hypothetical protein
MGYAALNAGMGMATGALTKGLRMLRRRMLAVALIGYAVFLMAGLGMWLVQGLVVPWDAKNHFYPMFRFLGASFAAGELPLWNPYHFSGHPTAADPQSLLFLPTIAFFAWLLPKASMQAFDALIFGHLAAGGLCLIGYFRFRGWHPLGGLLAAMIFVLGGAASSRLQHTGIIVSYSFIPVALLFLELALARASATFALVFAIAAAAMALGRDQVAFLGCIFVLATFGCRLLLHARQPGWLAARWPSIAIMGVAGAALIAVPALLTLQFVADSTRPAFGFGTAAMGSVPPVSLATLVWANVFGSLNWNYSYWGPMLETVRGGTWTERASTYMFMGTFPVLILLSFGIMRGRLFRREIVPFTMVAAATLLYALGRYTPFFGLLFDNFPGVHLYRRPNDALFLLNFAFAILCGYLIHRYVADVVEGDAPHPILRRASLAAGLATALLLVGLGFWAVAFSEDRRDPDVLRALVAILPICAAGAILAFGWRERRVLVAGALVAITGAELVWRNAASSMNAEPRERYAVYDKLSPDHERGLSALVEAIRDDHAAGIRPRVEILGMPGAWQNAAMVLGIEDTVGYNPLRIARFARAVGPGENAEDMESRTFPATFRGYNSAIATMLGLRYLVLPKPYDDLPAHFPRTGGLDLIFEGRDIFIYRLPQAMPRAYLAHRLHAIAFDEVIQTGEVPEFERRNEALLDPADIAALGPSFEETTTPAEIPSDSVRILAYSRNTIRIEVVTARPGVLVLHDLYYPGWIATVNGRERRVLRANLLFRGVEVAAGRHLVAFSFAPFSPANLRSVAESVFYRNRSPVPAPSIAAR